MLCSSGPSLFSSATSSVTFSPSPVNGIEGSCEEGTDDWWRTLYAAYGTPFPGDADLSEDGNSGAQYFLLCSDSHDDVNAEASDASGEPEPEDDELVWSSVLVRTTLADWRVRMRLKAARAEASAHSRGGAAMAVAPRGAVGVATAHDVVGGGDFPLQVLRPWLPWLDGHVERGGVHVDTEMKEASECMDLDGSLGWKNSSQVVDASVDEVVQINLRGGDAEAVCTSLLAVRDHTRVLSTTSSWLDRAERVVEMIGVPLEEASDRINLLGGDDEATRFFALAIGVSIEVAVEWINLCGGDVEAARTCWLATGASLQEAREWITLCGGDAEAARTFLLMVASSLEFASLWIKQCGGDVEAARTIMLATVSRGGQ